MSANVNMLNVYIVSVKWKDKLGGVRKMNFIIDIKISGAFYTENKIPVVFLGHGTAILLAFVFYSSNFNNCAPQATLLVYTGLNSNYCKIARYF